MSDHEVGIGSIVEEFVKDGYKSQVFSYYKQGYGLIFLCASL